MRIPLVGPSAENRSLTADSERSINVYTESGGTKSPKGFYGKPGVRARKTLGGTITCLASVNDRLFATAANTLLEIDSSWNTAQSVSGITTSTNSVVHRDRIVLNGLPRHLQALVVANGNCYSWEDQFPNVTPIRIGDVKSASGHVDTDGVNVHSWGSPFGETFRGQMAGQAIWLNGTAYVVDSVQSDTQLTLTTSGGTLQNATYKAQPAFNGVCDTSGNQVTNDGTGDPFDVLMPSQTITINSVDYVVSDVADSLNLTLTTSAGNQTGVSWTGTIDLAGQCDVNGTTVTFDGAQNEDLFSGWMAGNTITLASTTYTVAQVLGPYDLVLTSPVPKDFAVPWSAESPPILAGKCDTDDRAVHNNGPESILDRDGNPVGDLFDPVGMGGQPIKINGVTYMVDYVISPWDLMLTTNAPVQRGVDWVCDSLVLQASSACELGGYAVVTRPNSRQFNISALNDFSSWDPLDFALKEGSTDNLVGCIAHRGELWLFGFENIEVWDLSGNPDFPFARNAAGSLARGLGGAQTLVELTNGILCFIGDDGVGYRTQGFSLVAISTRAQEQAWRKEFHDAIAFAYTERGHIFWQINLSTVTWVYDATENEWTERGLLLAGNTFGRDIPQFYDHLSWSGSRTATDEGGTQLTQGTHVVCGWNDAILYEMSADFYDDNGTAIRYVRRFPHLVSEKLRIFLHKLTFEVESGTVNAGDPEPQMELRISTDGGKTWRQGTAGGDLIVTTGMGTNGQTRKRVVYRRLGSGRDLVPEIAVTQKARFYVADAYGEITQGNA